MTVGELRAALANPMIEDRHEVYIGTRVMGAKLEVVDALVDSKPTKARVFVIVPVAEGPYTIQLQHNHDEFLEEEDA